MQPSSLYLDSAEDLDMAGTKRNTAKYEKIKQRNVADQIIESTILKHFSDQIDQAWYKSNMHRFGCQGTMA